MSDYLTLVFQQPISSDVQRVLASGEWSAASHGHAIHERDRYSALCDKWNMECDAMREDNKRLADVAQALEQERDEWIACHAKIYKQRDDLLAAAEAVEIDAEECMGFDDFIGMFIPIDSYHKLMEAISRVKGGES